MRSNLYGKPQSLRGDKTSHGGVVVSGSTTNTWHGIPVVRKGDKVYCPRCKPHFFEVAEGLANCTDTNAALPMATEGHPTTCGAVLIAEQASSSQIAAALSLLNGTGFDQQIKFRTPEGRLLADLFYVITLSDDQKIHGKTDANGQSDRLFTVGKTDIVSVVFNLDADLEEYGDE